MHWPIRLLLAGITGGHRGDIDAAGLGGAEHCSAGSFTESLIP